MFYSEAFLNLSPAFHHTLCVSFPAPYFLISPIRTMQPFHLGHVSHHSVEGMEVDCMHPCESV